MTLPWISPFIKLKPNSIFLDISLYEIKAPFINWSKMACSLSLISWTQYTLLLGLSWYFDWWSWQWMTFLFDISIYKIEAKWINSISIGQTENKAFSWLSQYLILKMALFWTSSISVVKLSNGYLNFLDIATYKIEAQSKFPRHLHYGRSKNAFSWISAL